MVACSLFDLRFDFKTSLFDMRLFDILNNKIYKVSFPQDNMYLASLLPWYIPKTNPEITGSIHTQFEYINKYIKKLINVP